MFHALEITFELIVCELFRGCYDFVSLFFYSFLRKASKLFYIR